MKDSTKDRLEFIKTVCSVVSALGVIVAVCVWVNYHERARAEKGVQLLSDFAKTLGPSTRAVQILAESINAKQLQAIYDGNSFLADQDDRDFIQVALTDTSKPDFATLTPESPSPTTNVQSEKFQMYVVSSAQSFALRWKIVSYLNSVEVICEAWLTDVGDKEMLASELSGLYEPQKHQTFCRAYRELFQGNIHYPALTSFVKTLEEPSPKSTTIGPP